MGGRVEEHSTTSRRIATEQMAAEDKRRLRHSYQVGPRYSRDCVMSICSVCLVRGSSLPPALLPLLPLSSRVCGLPGAGGHGEQGTHERCVGVVEARSLLSLPRSDGGGGGVAASNGPPALHFL
jgi:hypothetical protein